MTKTTPSTKKDPRSIRGWIGDDHPTATCPACGSGNTLRREAYWTREATCTGCGLKGRVSWNNNGGHSAYLIVRMSDPGNAYLSEAWAARSTAEEHYMVFNVQNGNEWAVSGWRPEVVENHIGHGHLPGYALAEVHREWAKDKLREDLTPGMTVYTTFNHTGRTGMNRSIGVKIIVDGRPVAIDHFVAAALDWPFDENHGGVKVDGCGMDMGFHLVYSLSSALFPNGHECIGKDCPSNDHNSDYNEFSHAYDAKYAPQDVAPWWLSSESFGAGEGLTPDQQAQRVDYQKRKASAWKRGERARYAPSRRHSDGGYALRHAWL